MHINPYHDHITIDQLKTLLHKIINENPKFIEAMDEVGANITTLNQALDKANTKQDIVIAINQWYA